MKALRKIKLKILHLINTLVAGGAELHLLTLCRHLKRQGVEVAVACLKERAPDAPSLRARFEAEGIRVMHMKGDSRYNPGFLLRVFRLLSQEKFDLLHTHLPRADLAGALSSFINPSLPWVSSVHNIHNQSWSAKWALPWYKHVWQRADAVIAISVAVSDWLQEEHQLPSEKVKVIHYGIEADPFSRPSCDLRQDWNLNGQAVIGAIGRLEPRKGHETLIRAMPEVLREVPGAVLLIAGPDMWGYGSTLQTLIEALGLAGQVRLVGFQADIPSFLHCLDIFAFATLEEGFGQVLVEAMAAGKPVVATGIAPITEIVMDGITGLLAPPRDPQAFAQALLWLLQNPNESRRLGERGGRRVREYFTAERMSRQTLELYENILKKDQQFTGG
jgi:glycosyltransferase involved in cell wall biosynthesis